MVWSRTATVGPWRPPCPGSEVAGRQAAAPAASRPVGIGPAVRLLAGRRSYVDGLGALLTLGDVELDRLALVQGAIVLDGAGVHEHVGAGLGLDEAVALVGVEPLDGSTSHAACPPLLWEWLGAWGRGPGRRFRRLPGCRSAWRCWPRRLPWPSRSPPRPWSPPAGRPAGSCGPGPLWSLRSCGRPCGGTSPRGRGDRPRPRGEERCPRRPG